MRRWLIQAAVVLIATGGAGCGTLHPNAIGAKAPEVTVEAGTSARINPQLHQFPNVTFKALGVSYNLDRDEYSQELVQLVTDALREAGADLTSGPEIRIRVDYLDFVKGGPCILDYRVWLAAETPVGMQALGESSNFQIACRKALQNATQDSRVKALMARSP